MKNIFVISKYTFIEVYRSKVMLGILFLSVAMIFMTFIASAFAYGAPEKVALDFSIGIMSVTNLLMSIFLGVTLVSKEIESRTLYMIISRPISRFSYLLGKIIGLSSVLIINTIFLTLVGMISYRYLGGVGDELIYWVSFFNLLEAIIILLFGVLFSLISNPSLAAVFTMLVLISGHAITSTISNFFAKSSTTVMMTLKYSLFFIPDLDRLNLKDFLIYKQSLPANFLLSNFLYASFYIGAILIALSLIFDKKNLD